MTDKTAHGRKNNRLIPCDVSWFSFRIKVRYSTRTPPPPSPHAPTMPEKRAARMSLNKFI
jgi:hypothetical protein